MVLKFIKLEPQANINLITTLNERFYQIVMQFKILTNITNT